MSTRRLLLVWALLLAGIVYLSQQPTKAYWQSRDSNYNIAISGGGAAFTGMADIVPSPFACWSLRACSAATRGTKALNVCNVADVACADLLTDGTTGSLVIPTIGGSSCSIVSCTIKTAYDQSGAANCTPACDVTQATIASRPTLVVSCVGGLPCMACSGTQFLVSPASAGIVQTFSASAVAKRTGNTSAFSDIIGIDNGGNAQFLFNNSANQVILYAGTLTAGVTAADNAFHAFQGIYAGAASAIYLDGSSTTGLNAGTANGSAMSLCTGTNSLTGNIAEAGLWPVGFNGTQQANMNTNQHSYWGF